MANQCDFSMRVNGKHENIEMFFGALTQKDKVWMGRGAVADIEYYDEDNMATIEGWCKWSIQSALIDDAIEMQKQKETGKGRWLPSEINAVDEFLTLFEACQKYHVNMEVYSSEVGCEFQEHFKYENGDIVDESTDYTEIFDEDSQEWVGTGGYSWDFDLAEVE